MVKWSVSALDHYKASISRPLASHNVRFCRFHPSCSVYGRTALLRFGFLKGGALAFIRVLKCNPFYGHPPIEDPVPVRGWQARTPRHRTGAERR
ncbi:MAG: membrane protein insertion efficiency factor YidD [Acidobacteria bacterium]|nr:membrane protein insertion efficiency factor YidD [Acidobacteriota bacterium]